MRLSPLSSFCISAKLVSLRSYSVSLPGRQRRFSKVLLDSYLHSREWEFNLELNAFTTLVYQRLFYGG